MSVRPQPTVLTLLLVAEQERKQAEKDSKSVLKGIGRAIHKASNAITGDVDDEDMEEADEVSLSNPNPHPHPP